MTTMSNSNEPAKVALELMVSSNPFALLGLPETYDVSAAAIEAAYFERSKQWHPDNFAGAVAATRIVALSNSRAINDAYKTLKKSTTRAEALLAISGVVIGAHERLEPGFLMEILEQREVLSEARAAGRVDEVAAMQSSMMARRQQIVALLAPAFLRGDVVDAKRQLIILRYLDRYLEECDAALDEV
jgi:Fe-S protein assembly co-chaperone HscB